MITLRYHIITIVSVFLSLGLGIILGGSIGQNWINEKQQTLLVGLEDKYDQALKSNEDLKQQIQALSSRIEQANEEFSTYVSKGYITDLKGKKIGIWQNGETDTEQLKQFLMSVGLELVPIQEADGTWKSPILFVGSILPEWSAALTDGNYLQVESASLTPSQQWELLQKIQQLYKENAYEY